MESALRHCGCNGRERLPLRLVQRVFVRVLLAVGGKAAEMKVLGHLFDRDQAALDQRRQRGGRDAEFAQRHGLAQIDHAHASACGGDLGENGGLVPVELGNARIRNQHGDALGAARVALFNEGFAGEPLLTDHAGKQGLVGIGFRANRRGLGRVAVDQIIQRRELAVPGLPR